MSIFLEVFEALYLVGSMIVFGMLISEDDDSLSKGDWALCIILSWISVGGIVNEWMNDITKTGDE